MNIGQQMVSAIEARQIDMVDYLAKVGYQPVKIRNNDYWYLSPLLEEKNSSFKVNRKLNRWYDHGLGQGGNLLDFGVLYHNMSVKEFLLQLGNDFSFHQPTASVKKSELSSDQKILILGESSIYSFALLRYLHQRRIPIDIAEAFCKEVSYRINGKNYYAIGFRNDGGGYELRNPYFKASSTPKGITSIQNGAGEANVFEGIFDFLSFFSINKNQPLAASNFIILNSLSFFEKAPPFMEQHGVINLYLDRDIAGQNCSLNAMTLSSKYKDASGLYKNYKDLNDWLVHFGKRCKQGIKP